MPRPGLRTSRTASAAEDEVGKNRREGRLSYRRKGIEGGEILLHFTSLRNPLLRPAEKETSREGKGLLLLRKKRQKEKRSPFQDEGIHVRHSRGGTSREEFLKNGSGGRYMLSRKAPCSYREKKVPEKNYSGEEDGISLEAAKKRGKGRKEKPLSSHLGE